MCAPTIFFLWVMTMIAPSLAPSARARSLWIEVLAPDLDVALELLARLRLGEPGVRELGVGERAPRHRRHDLALAGEEHVAHRRARPRTRPSA